MKPRVMLPPELVARVRDAALDTSESRIAMAVLYAVPPDGHDGFENATAMLQELFRAIAETVRRRSEKSPSLTRDSRWHIHEAITLQELTEVMLEVGKCWVTYSKLAEVEASAAG